MVFTFYFWGDDLKLVDGGGTKKNGSLPKLGA
jgi:hypothetical protein